MTSIIVGRRALLGWAGAVALVPGRLRAASTPDIMAPFIRMRCGPGGRPCLWVYNGVLILQEAGDVARKVLGVSGVSINRAERQADGSYRYWLDEAGYYCDLESGRPLARWRNPLTGEMLTPRHYRSPQSYIFDGQRVYVAGPTSPLVTYRGDITGPTRLGDRLFMGEDIIGKRAGVPGATTAAARRPTVFTSMATFTASAAETEGTSEWVAATCAYATMNTPAPWFGLAARSVIANMRLDMVKSRDLDDIPKWLRERLATDQPDLLMSFKT